MAKEKPVEIEEAIIENAPEHEKEIIREIQEKGKENAVIIKSTELSRTDRTKINNLQHFKSTEDLLAFSQMLVDSKIVPFKSAEQAATIMLQGKELGLSPVTALYNLYYIEGKPCLSIHAHNALLRRAGILINTIEDGVGINAKGDIAVEGRVDLRTTIRFKRHYKQFDEIVSENGVFTFSEAKAAKLNEKSNWKSYPRQMLWNRAFTIGARRIAADILMGCMEVSEMADASGIDYDLTEDNSVNFK